MERDYNNAYDNYAIKALNINGHLLGYVAKAWASVFAEKLDIGISYETSIKEIEPKVLLVKAIRSNPEEVALPKILNY